MKKEDIETITKIISILEKIELPKDLHANKDYKTVGHAIDHLKWSLPKKKKEE